MSLAGPGPEVTGGPAPPAPPRAHGVTLLVDDLRGDAREGPGRAPRLQGRDPREGRDEDHPRLRLPPRVHDGAPAAPDRAIVPAPRLGADGVPDGPQEPAAPAGVPLGA